jgi:hypothetical protein
LDHALNIVSPDSARADVDARPRAGYYHIMNSRRQSDGRWLLDDAHDEALAFPFGETVGEPSRWNTLRALRVQRWYERL